MITQKKISRFFYVMFDKYTNELCDYLYDHPDLWPGIEKGMDVIYNRELSVLHSQSKESVAGRIVELIKDKAKQYYAYASATKEQSIKFALGELRKEAYLYVLSEIAFWDRSEESYKKVEEIYREVMYCEEDD